MNAPNVKKSRRSFILVCVAFILPIVLAKLALEQQWFNYGVTNKGQLIERELTVADLGLNAESFNGKWLMVYVVSSPCTSYCQQVFQNVNNTYVALGKEMPRVIPVALSNEDFSKLVLDNDLSKKWILENSNSISDELLVKPQILLVDTLGNIILTHEIPANAEQLPFFGKAILADFKKLLKYSRIG